jgi:hypothetical protein
LIISGFNPVAPAVFIAILTSITVLLLFLTLRFFCSFSLSYILSSMYAFSAVIVDQNRNNWNPTTIPLFIALVMYAMCRIWFGKRYWWICGVGFACGILIQLHLSNIFTCLIALGFWIVVVYKRKPELPDQKWFKLTLLGILIALVPSVSYFYYEIVHQFSDVRNLLSVLFLGNPLKNSADVIRPNLSSYPVRLFSFIMPYLSKMSALVLSLIVIIRLLMKRSVVGIFTIVWFVGGVITLFILKIQIYNHYLMFLSLLPSVMIGLAVSSIQNKHIYRTTVFVLGLLSIVNLITNNLSGTGHHDIARTKALVSEMITQSRGRPFSFTMSTSRSYSDYHYRFFFRLAGVTPQPITGSYEKLFIICEEGKCPSGDEENTSGSVQAICWDLHCGINYPRIRFTNRHVVLVKDIGQARMYTLDK